MAGLHPDNQSLPLICGALAGFTVDVALFPIDTIKTRLQSELGFAKAGGFKGVYSGLRAAAVGSVPAATVFFTSYEMTKKKLAGSSTDDATVHMASGCVAEIFACMVRIPFEVVKQTAQANPQLSSTTEAKYRILNTVGFRGLFRGYFSMVFRDAPFSIIQMPIWEFLKCKVRKHNLASTGTEYITGPQSGACGAIAGGITGAITTPLDVVKTRIILSQNFSNLRATHSENPVVVLSQILRQEGIVKLYSGLVPRVGWLAGGGFLFFGSYDFFKNLFVTYDIL